MMKLEELEAELKCIYGEKLPEEAIQAYANELHYTFFVRRESLDNIFSVVYENEFEYEIADKDSEAYLVYRTVVDALEDCEDTARRLYDEFMYSYDDLDLAIKLIVFNDEWLTEEELKAAKRKAWKIFDKDLLKELGFGDWGKA